MTKYAYEYGKRWKREIPRFQIARSVERLHVAETNEAVEQVILDCIMLSPDVARYTPVIIRQCLAYAIECHKRNRVLAWHVARGF